MFMFYVYASMVFSTVLLVVWWIKIKCEQKPKSWEQHPGLHRSSLHYSTVIYKKGGGVGVVRGIHSSRRWVKYQDHTRQWYCKQQSIICGGWDYWYNIQHFLLLLLCTIHLSCTSLFQTVGSVTWQAASMGQLTAGSSAWIRVIVDWFSHPCQ